MAQPSVIVLEFNELSPRLMDRFIAAGELPNFERLRHESTVAITDPEETQDKLNPWIQWVTLHTGARRTDHGIEKLGEASRLQLPTIGEVVSDAGLPVWICGTMNLPSRTAPQGAYLPDPWNPTPMPRPAGLAEFNDFVRANVQEHTNASATMSPGQAARFAWFCTRHGLSRRTMSDAVLQLVGERRGTRGRWARASVLDRFQWDLFRWQLRREAPAFATFFSNSTAHYQHMYWRNLEPEAFDSPPTEQEQDEYRDAVLHGYRSMDVLVGEAVELADEMGSTLMMCTALSQQPYVHADDTGGKFTYRPHDFRRLIDVLGIEGVVDIAPVMAGEFRLYLDSERAAATAADRLRGASVAGDDVFATRVTDGEVLTGCRITDPLEDGTKLVDADGGVHDFFELFYRFETAKSGYHHPDGMWWVRTGLHQTIDDVVPLRSVAPSILQMLDVAPPSSMQAPPMSHLVGARP